MSKKDKLFIEKDRSRSYLLDENTRGLKSEFTYLGCPFCDSKDYVYYQSALTKNRPVKFGKCNLCGLVYAVPRLNKEKLTELVNSVFLQNHFKSSYANANFKNRPAAKNTAFKKITGYLRRSILRIETPTEAVRRLLGKKSSNVLDIGCAGGEFLLSLKNSRHSLYGIEPNEASCRIAKDEGLNVFCEYFTKEAVKKCFPEASFDVVVFLDSLYYFFNIKETLQNAGDILNDRGYLIIQSFNIDSPEIRFFEESSNGIDPLDMPTMFSLKSIKSVLGKSGFKIAAAKGMLGGGLKNILCNRYYLLNNPAGRLLIDLLEIIFAIIRKSRRVFVVAQKI